MTDSSVGPAEAAFRVGLNLLAGKATAGPDGPFESARGAMISAIACEDPEWSPRAAYTLAMALFDRGDLDGARDYAEVAYKSGHPEWSVGAVLVLAHVAAPQRLQEPAIGAFHAVIESGRPQFLPSAWYNLGTVYQQRQEWTEAADAYEQAMSTRDPEFAPKAATNLGFVLANYLDDQPGSRRAFETAAESGDPEQVQLATRNLQAMDELDRLRRAGTSAVPAEDGTDMSVDRGAGRKKRRWWFVKTQGAQPDAGADNLLRMGERLEKRGDLPGAEDAYRHADAAGSAEAASNLGALLFERGDVEGAHAALVRADKRGSGMGTFRLGFLLQEIGRTEEAERAYRRAVERGNEHAANNLAVMLRSRGDHAGAREVEQNMAGGRSGGEAILAEAEGRGIPTFRVDSADDLLIGMAKAEHEQGRSEHAEQILRELVAAGRQSRGLAALNLGMLLEERGDTTGAQQAYETVLASEDRSGAGAASLNLGVIAAARGHHAEAERLFRTAAESDHPQARIVGAFNLGTALAQRGAFAEARQYYRRAMESEHPQYAPMAAEMLAELP